VLGQAVQKAEGRPQSADDLARVERGLRKLTHKALRRLRRDPTGNKARTDKLDSQQQAGGAMARIIRKRIVEIEYEGEGPEAAAHDDDLADPRPDPDDDLDDLDDLDGDLGDDDLDDEDEED